MPDSFATIIMSHTDFETLEARANIKSTPLLTSKLELGDTLHKLGLVYLNVIKVPGIEKDMKLAKHYLNRALNYLYYTFTKIKEDSVSDTDKIKIIEGISLVLAIYELTQKYGFTPAHFMEFDLIEYYKRQIELLEGLTGNEPLKAYAIPKLRDLYWRCATDCLEKAHKYSLKDAELSINLEIAYVHLEKGAKLSNNFGFKRKLAQLDTSVCTPELKALVATAAYEVGCLENSASPRAKSAKNARHFMRIAAKLGHKEAETFLRREENRSPTRVRRSVAFNADTVVNPITPRHKGTPEEEAAKKWARHEEVRRAREEVQVEKAGIVSVKRTHTDSSASSVSIGSERERGLSVLVPHAEVEVVGTGDTWFRKMASCFWGIHRTSAGPAAIHSNEASYR